MTGPGSPLQVTTTWPRADVCVVRLAGELDMSTAPVVREHLRRQAAAGPAHVVLDLAALELISAAGISVLVTATLDEQGRLHVVAPARGVVLRMLRLTGVDAVLRVRASVAEALDDANEPRPT